MLRPGKGSDGQTESTRRGPRRSCGSPARPVPHGGAHTQLAGGGRDGCAPVPLTGDQVVASWGPGRARTPTSSPNGSAGAGTLAVELNPRLAALLGRRHPGLDVAVAGAAELPGLLAARGLGGAASSCRACPGPPTSVARPRLTDVIAGCLGPDGAFTQFTYVWSRWAPPARRQHRWLRDAFEEVVPSRTVWPNLPPALVYLARGRGARGCRVVHGRHPERPNLVHRVVRSRARRSAGQATARVAAQCARPLPGHAAAGLPRRRDARAPARRRSRCGWPPSCSRTASSTRSPSSRRPST